MPITDYELSSVNARLRRAESRLRRSASRDCEAAWYRYKGADLFVILLPRLIKNINPDYNAFAESDYLPPSSRLCPGRANTRPQHRLPRPSCHPNRPGLLRLRHPGQRRPRPSRPLRRLHYVVCPRRHRCPARSIPRVGEPGRPAILGTGCHPPCTPRAYLSI